MTYSPETSTIGDIVSEDYRAAAIFQRYGIDFCCGGGRQLAAACLEKGIEPSEVIDELMTLEGNAGDGGPRFKLWEPALLMDYIVANHHQYLRRALPSLSAWVEKVASVHGERHPEVGAVAEHFSALRKELESHMQKEEQVLFPYVRRMFEAEASGEPPPPSPFGSVRNPILMMEAEHRAAGEGLEAIRDLTSGYTPPPDACTTFKVCYQELRDLERDLHQHIHLENNILFPRAVSLEQRKRGELQNAR
jgi:regulator of cell morphogenesis and NO signaling